MEENDAGPLERYLIELGLPSHGWQLQRRAMIAAMHQAFVLHRFGHLDWAFPVGAKDGWIHWLMDLTEQGGGGFDCGRTRIKLNVAPDETPPKRPIVTKIEAAHASKRATRKLFMQFMETHPAEERRELVVLFMKATGQTGIGDQILRGLDRAEHDFRAWARAARERRSSSDRW